MQSLESVPSWFSDFTGINLEAGEVILSIVVILAAVLPTMYLSMQMKHPSNLPTIFMFFLTASFLVGIGWLDIWIMIALICLMAMSIAWFGRKIATGG